MPLPKAKTIWPSGLRRWLTAPVRKGVGSNPTAVILQRGACCLGCAFQRANGGHLPGTWCSGITSASHAEGPGFNPQCVHIRACCSRMRSHPRARLRVHVRTRNWLTAAHAPRESPQPTQARPQLRPCALTPADVSSESNATTQRRFRVGAARAGIAVTWFGSRPVALPCQRSGAVVSARSA